jgi:hypothetical protein
MSNVRWLCEISRGYILDQTLSICLARLSIYPATSLDSLLATDRQIDRLSKWPGAPLCRSKVPSSSLRIWLLKLCKTLENMLRIHVVLLKFQGEPQNPMVYHCVPTVIYIYCDFFWGSKEKSKHMAVNPCRTNRHSGDPGLFRNLRGLSRFSKAECNWFDR